MDDGNLALIVNPLLTRIEPSPDASEYPSRLAFDRNELLPGLHYAHEVANQKRDPSQTPAPSFTVGDYVTWPCRTLKTTHLSQQLDFRKRDLSR